MKKRLMIAVFVLGFAVQGWGADQNIYIDADAATGGDGTITTPYDAFSDINWSAGGANSIHDWVNTNNDVYINLLGTFTSSLFTATTGTATARITIQGYGSGAIINTSSSTGILIRNESFYTVKNITLHECATNGLTVDTFSGSATRSNIIIDNVTASSNGGDGIFFWGDDYLISDIIVRNCTTLNNGGAGIFFDQRISDVLVELCTSTGDSTNEPMWGIIASGLHSDALSSGWSLVSGTTYNRAWTTPVVDIPPPINTNYDYLTAVGISPSDGEYWYDSANSLLYVNLGADPNSMDLMPIEYYANNITIQDCIIDDTKDPTTNEGHGVGLEVAVQNSVIKRCASKNNAGSGIANMVNRDNEIIYNISYSNAKSGISTQRNKDIIIAHNTCFNNDKGLYVFYYNDLIIKNNIFENNITSGLFKSSGTALITLDNNYNDAYGNGTNFSNVTKGSNSIETDPIINTIGRLSSASPCIDTGTWVTGVNDGGEADIWGSYVFRLPNIGADQKYSTGGSQKGGSRILRIGGGGGIN